METSMFNHVQSTSKVVCSISKELFMYTCTPGHGSSFAEFCLLETQEFSASVHDTSYGNGVTNNLVHQDMELHGYTGSGST